MLHENICDFFPYGFSCQIYVKLRRLCCIHSKQTNTVIWHIARISRQCCNQFTQSLPYRNSKCHMMFEWVLKVCVGAVGFYFFFFCYWLFFRMKKGVALLTSYFQNRSAYSLKHNLITSQHYKSQNTRIFMFMFYRFIVRTSHHKHTRTQRSCFRLITFCSRGCYQGSPNFLPYAADAFISLASLAPWWPWWGVSAGPCPRTASGQTLPWRLCVENSGAVA